MPRALRIRAFGEASTAVELAQVDTLQPGPGEVRVRMLYAAVNPSDRNWIDGTYYRGLGRVLWNTSAAEGKYTFDPTGNEACRYPPYTLGVEGVGVVEATGSGLLARRLRGKRVAVSADNGTWQDTCIVDAKKAVALPAGIDDQQGAMLFVNPMTAWLMINQQLRVQAGETVLVTAAGSALADMVIRLSRKQGFKVIGVVRRSEAVASVKQKGAHAVVATDAEDLVQAVHKLTGGQGVEYALDCVAGDTAAQVMRCMTLDGQVLLYGTLSGQPVTIEPRDLMMPGANVSGFFLPNVLRKMSLLQKLSMIKKVQRLVAEGVLSSEVGAVYPLEEYEQALQAAFAPARQGKVLFRIGADAP